MIASGAKSKKYWFEYGAALWAAVFGLLHIVWAFGWYVGLDAQSAQKAFERGWFLIYDTIAAGLCLVAVGAALALVRRWGRKIPPGWLAGVVWSCAIVLVLRGGAGAVYAIYTMFSGSSLSPLFSFWNWWFCLGAFFFVVSARRFAPGAA